MKSDIRGYVAKLAHDSGHPTADALYGSLMREGCSDFAITVAAQYLDGEYTINDGGRQGCQFCTEEVHVPTVEEAKARKFLPCDEDCSLMIETNKFGKARQPPANDWWGTQEDQDFWLKPGTQHYMNATPNSTKNYQLTKAFRDSYVKIRGYKEYEIDKLKQELKAYIATLVEGEKITSVITPPEAIKALKSLPAPGRFNVQSTRSTLTLQLSVESHIQKINTCRLSTQQA